MADDTEQASVPLGEVTEARVHAEAFVEYMARHPERDLSRVHLDATDLTGWFAQAIEAGRRAGHAEGYQRGTKETREAMQPHLDASQAQVRDLADRLGVKLAEERAAEAGVTHDHHAPEIDTT